ncbi:MAG: LETM1 domain-containing protein [Flavobacteriaceae bacterium]
MTKQEVTDLIERNKNSLLKEVKESKELLFLIKESATRKLTDDEKSKVKEQLLDICKSIPAFTVFMLPGGALLLPLLIKMIPNILPSAFREKV